MKYFVKNNSQKFIKNSDLICRQVNKNLKIYSDKFMLYIYHFRNLYDLII